MSPQAKTTEQYFADVLEYSSNRVCNSLREMEAEALDPVKVWQEAELHKAISCAVADLLCPPIIEDPEPEPEPDPDPLP